MELMEEGMKLTKDIMKATGETIAVCEMLDVDPRLVARVLLGVIEWADREPELAVEEPPPAPWQLDPESQVEQRGHLCEPFTDEQGDCKACEQLEKPPVRSRFRDVPPDPARPWERYSMPEAKPAQEAPPTAPWDDMELVPRPPPPLVPLPTDGERDAKGRKVVKRDHNWRENTLQRMQVGESALMSYLLEQLPGVTRGAMAQRMAMLVAEGHLEQIGPGSWRRIK